LINIPSKKHPSSWVGACPGDEESGSELHPPVAAGQPSYARILNQTGKCGGQIQRKHLWDSLSPLRGASRTQSNHWNNCP